MKICVLVKEVPDAAVEKRIDPSTGRLDRNGEKNLNPFDTHAIEAAMQLKEGGAVDVEEIVAVTMGPETALCSARTAVSGPIVTATTSSTSTAPPSLSCIAASIAWVSNGFRFFSPLRSSRFEFGSIRFSTAASGTSLTRTQIFTSKLLVLACRAGMAPAAGILVGPLTDGSVAPLLPRGCGH